MATNNDNLLESIVPHLEDHLKNLKEQKEDIDAKIREVERHLAQISNNSPTGRSGKQRRPKGANKALLKAWFEEHPEKRVGQAEIATLTGITSSSARAALDRLEKNNVLERDGSAWRLKQKQKFVDSDDKDPF